MNKQSKIKLTKISIVLMICVMSIIVFYGVFASAWGDDGTVSQNIDGCNELNTTNAVYTLTKDIDTTGTCFTILADNVTLDMNGFNITGDDGSQDYGVYVNGYNETTIKNGEIYDFDVGIYLLNNKNNNITNVTANSMAYGWYGVGIYLVSSSNNTLTSITTDSNTVGVNLGSSLNNILTNINAASNSVYGVYFYLGSNNNLTNSNVNLNEYGIYFDSSSNNTLTNITANSNLQDGISFDSSSNNILTTISIDLNINEGINLASSSNNILTDIITTSNSEGIYMSSDSNNNTLTNITAESNLNGIEIDGSLNNTLTDIEANFNTGAGIYIHSSSNNNTLIEIDTFSNGYGIQIDSSSSNILTDIIANSHDRGISFSSSSNNTITNMQINPDMGDSYGVYLDSSSNNKFISGDIYADAENDTYLSSTSINNTFLDVAYTTEYVEAGSELIRKWYFSSQTNFTHNGTEVVGANVYAYNVLDIVQNNELSDVNGQTSVWELIEYINTGARSYYTNYTFNATYSPWDVTSRSINLTTNFLDTQFNITELTAPNIQFVTNSTTSGTYNQSWIYANVTASDIASGLDTIILNLSNSSGLINSSNSTSSPFGFNFTDLIDGTYYMNASTNDTVNNVNITETRTIILDTTIPVISLTRPVMGSTYNDLSLNITLTTNEACNCQYSIDSGTRIALITSDNLSFYRMQAFAFGDYTIDIYCNDILNHAAGVSASFTIGEAGGSAGSSSTVSTPTIIDPLRMFLEIDELWNFNKNNVLEIYIVGEGYEYINPNDIVYDFGNITGVSINKLNIIEIEPGIYNQVFNVIGDMESMKINISASVDALNDNLILTVTKQSYLDKKYSE